MSEMKPLAIMGTAARTAVGANAAQTCAAIRAGIRALREHPFLGGEPWDPEWDPSEPLVVAAVRRIAPDVAGAARLHALALPVLDELGRSARLRRADLAECALFVALPERDAARASGIGEGFASELAARAGLSFAVCEERFAGAAGGLALLAEASARIAAREVTSCLVLGVDSLFDPERAAALDRSFRLKTARNLDGFIPGEAAAAMFVEAESRAARRRAPILATVRAVGVGEEPEAIVHSEKVSTGRGLCHALGGALSRPPRWVVCDLNGESYRAFEWGIALARLGERLAGIERLLLPVLATGDVGAASGALFAACAVAAFERGYAAADEVLAWAGSDGGARAAAVIARS